MAKGTAIDRVLQFYRTASADTVRVVHQLAHEVMDERGIGRNGTRVKDKIHRKTRAGGKRTTATSAPKVEERAEAANGD